MSENRFCVFVLIETVTCLQPQCNSRPYGAFCKVSEETQLEASWSRGTSKTRQVTRGTKPMFGASRLSRKVQAN
jgi:hypothetical protein